MNTPVNFETAKLLKEKGFEQRTRSYNKDGKLVTVSLTIRKFNPEKVYYPAPTIAEVVMWLYEKHGIWISCEPYNVGRFKYLIIDESNGSRKENTLYNSPKQAYESGINYVLNNLI